MSDPRRDLLEACLSMQARGLTPGVSGNLSIRDGDGYWITPSGLPYDALSAEMMVFMDMQGGRRGALKPSSEWRFHRDIYRTRAEAGGVCHTHSAYATALACRRIGIPAFHYMVAVAGGDDIRCAPYHAFGTQALSDAALQALQDRRACLLANHGMIALGADVGDALRLAEEVESLARQYLLCRQLGEPAILSKAEMAEILEKFAGYGQDSHGQDGDGD